MFFDYSTLRCCSIIGVLVDVRLKVCVGKCAEVTARRALSFRLVCCRRRNQTRRQPRIDRARTNARTQARAHTHTHTRARDDKTKMALTERDTFRVSVYLFTYNLFIYVQGEALGQEGGSGMWDSWREVGYPLILIFFFSFFFFGDRRQSPVLSRYSSRSLWTFLYSRKLFERGYSWTNRWQRFEVRWEK